MSADSTSYASKLAEANSGAAPKNANAIAENIQRSQQRAMELQRGNLDPTAVNEAAANADPQLIQQRQNTLDRLEAAKAKQHVADRIGGPSSDLIAAVEELQTALTEFGEQVNEAIGKIRLRLDALENPSAALNEQLEQAAVAPARDETGIKEKKSGK